MIPPEAVEAAARAHQDLLAKGGYASWDAILPDGRDLRIRHMRAALEAATPHMLELAWEQGYGKGYSDATWQQGHESRDRNPYRPAP